MPRHSPPYQIKRFYRDLNSGKMITAMGSGQWVRFDDHKGDYAQLDREKSL